MVRMGGWRMFEIQCPACGRTRWLKRPPKNERGICQRCAAREVGLRRNLWGGIHGEIDMTPPDCRGDDRRFALMLCRGFEVARLASDNGGREADAE